MKLQWNCFTNVAFKTPNKHSNTLRVHTESCSSDLVTQCITGQKYDKLPYSCTTLRLN